MRPFFIKKRLEAEVLNFESKMNLIWTDFQHHQRPRTNTTTEDYEVHPCSWTDWTD